MARSDLVVPNSKKVAYPKREYDYVSARGVKYWWSPEWSRDLNGTIGRIKPITEKNGDVYLYMLSKSGNLTYIRGRIQENFIKWHEDNQIDWILLGMSPDDIMGTDWEYV